MFQPRLFLVLLALSHLRQALAHQIPLLEPQSHTEGYKFDALLHLPGISPYFDAIGSGLNHRAPQDCKVTAASYLIRHAAIYANDNDYERFIEPFLEKLATTSISSYKSHTNWFPSAENKKETRKGWTGPLFFFNKWQNPINDPEAQMEQITPQGIIDSKKVGKHLLSRYPSLIPTTKEIYVDKKSRTQDTAKAFISVFPQEIQLVEMRQKNTPSSHSQIPHKACKAFSKSPGDKELAQWLAKYSHSIIERLQAFSPVELEAKDIMGLQQLCGYESAITGKKSKICNVFTDDEWMSYEYAWDMKYAFMVGHMNPLSPYLGWPWLNTTMGLMRKFHAPEHREGRNREGRYNEARHRGGRPGNLGGEGEGKIPDEDGQRFFLAFTHREVPPFIATALGLFDSGNRYRDEWPMDGVNWSRSWRMAELIPFLGHVGVEKLSCATPRQHMGEDGNGSVKEYIRVIANTAPRPIPTCQDGPGASCSFDRFVELVEAGMDRFGDFDGVCGNEVETGVDDEGVGKTRGVEEREEL